MIPFLKYSIVKTCAMVAVAGLAGCQSNRILWTTFCDNEEWSGHGYYDAKEGLLADRSALYRSKCGNKFSDSELEEYHRGYAVGWAEICGEKQALTSSGSSVDCSAATVPPDASNEVPSNSPHSGLEVPLPQ